MTPVEIEAALYRAEADLVDAQRGLSGLNEAPNVAHHIQRARSELSEALWRIRSAEAAVSKLRVEGGGQ